MTITATRLAAQHRGAAAAGTRTHAGINLVAGRRYAVAVLALQNGAGTWNPATEFQVTDDAAVGSGWATVAVSADPANTAGGTNGVAMCIAITDTLTATQAGRSITIDFDNSTTTQYLSVETIYELSSDVGDIELVQVAGAAAGTAPALNWPSTPADFQLVAWGTVHNSSASFPTEPTGYTADYTNTATVCAIEVQTADGVTTDPVSFTPTVSGTQFSFHVAALELTDDPGGGVTGTASLTAPSATASATGSLTVSGAAAATATPATTAGTATTTVAATGTTAGPAGTASGTGTVGITGTGTATASPAVTAGTGTVAVAAAGAATAPAAVLTATAAAVATGSGAATTPAAALDSTGTAVVSGTGAPTAPPGVLAGSGTSESTTSTGTAHATAPAATVAGTGTVGITGTAALSASAATAAIAGEVAVAGAGTATAPPGQLAGTTAESEPGPAGLIPRIVPAAQFRATATAAAGFGATATAVAGIRSTSNEEVTFGHG